MTSSSVTNFENYLTTPFMRRIFVAFWHSTLKIRILSYKGLRKVLTLFRRREGLGVVRNLILWSTIDIKTTLSKRLNN